MLMKVITSLKLFSSCLDVIFNLRFFTHERILISNSSRNDKSIKIWNVYSGELLKEIQSHIYTGNNFLAWLFKFVLVWNGVLEVCHRNKWVVCEHNNKGVSIIKFDFEVSEAEYIYKKIVLNFR